MLKNPNNEDVCYKIKTTHVERYAVLPGAAVIAANDSADVEIVLIKKDTLPEEGTLEDRFLIQAAYFTDKAVKVPDFWAKGKGASVPTTEQVTMVMLTTLFVVVAAALFRTR